MEETWQELYDRLVDMRGRLLLMLAEGGDDSEIESLLKVSDCLEAQVLQKIARNN